MAPRGDELCLGRLDDGLVAALARRAQALLAQDCGQGLAGGGVQGVVADVGVVVGQQMSGLQMKLGLLDQVLGLLGACRHSLQMAPIE